MIKIIYVGKQNQTNSVVCEMIEANFLSDISFYDPESIFKQPKVLDDKKVDMAIFDLDSSYGVGTAPENIKKINHYVVNTPILVLYPYTCNTYIKPLMDAGAKGVLTSTPAEPELRNAIETLINGGTYIGIGKAN